jgi:hypothetical protein
MMEVRLDTKEFDNMAATLRTIGTKAMPSVAKTVLNNLAFEVKQKTLIATARKEFIVRAPGMFKAFSKVEKTTSNDIRAMHADVGMLGKGPGRTFDKQEEGGSYEHEYVPSDLVRKGQANAGRVVRKYLLKNKRIIEREFAKNKMQGHKKIIPDLAMGFRSKMWVFHRNRLLEVTSFKRGKKGERPDVKTKVLYTIPKTGRVQVEPVGLMEKAAEMAMTKAGRFYKRAALTYIKRNVSIR